MFENYLKNKNANDGRADSMQADFKNGLYEKHQKRYMLLMDERFSETSTEEEKTKTLSYFTQSKYLLHLKEFLKNN